MTSSRPFARLARKLQLMIGRAVLEAAKEDGLVRLKGLGDEVMEDIEGHWPYGLFARPVEGATALHLAIGAARSHGAALIDDPRHRPADLEDGEVVLYNDQAGTEIRLTQDGAVHVKGARVIVEADEVHLGGESGAAIARVGDQVQVGGETGQITGGSSTVKSI